MLNSARRSGGAMNARRHMLSDATLPMAIAEVRNFGPAPADGMLQCVAVGRKVGSAAITTDIVLSDASGRRVAELRGVETIKVPRTG